MLSRFYKNKKTDKIWWIDDERIGIWEFTFDKKKIYNLFRDYPFKLTAEQKKQFDKENPYWADFFSDRRS